MAASRRPDIVGLLFRRGFPRRRVATPLPPAAGFERGAEGGGGRRFRWVVRLLAFWSTSSRTSGWCEVNVAPTGRGAVGRRGPQWTSLPEPKVQRGQDGRGPAGLAKGPAKGPARAFKGHWAWRVSGRVARSGPVLVVADWGLLWSLSAAAAKGSGSPCLKWLRQLRYSRPAVLRTS